LLLKYHHYDVIQGLILTFTTHHFLCLILSLFLIIAICQLILYEYMDESMVKYI